MIRVSIVNLKSGEVTHQADFVDQVAADKWVSSQTSKVRQASLRLVFDGLPQLNQTFDSEAAAKQYWASEKTVAMVESYAKEGIKVTADIMEIGLENGGWGPTGSFEIKFEDVSKQYAKRDAEMLAREYLISTGDFVLECLETGAKIPQEIAEKRAMARSVLSGSKEVGDVRIRKTS